MLLGTQAHELGRGGLRRVATAVRVSGPTMGSSAEMLAVKVRPEPDVFVPLVGDVRR